MWSFPGVIIYIMVFLGLVATAGEWCKTLPAWSRCAHRHHEARQWSCHPARSWEPSGSCHARLDQTIQNTRPIVLAEKLGKKTRNTEMRRETQLTTIIWLSWYQHAKLNVSASGFSKRPNHKWSYHTLTISDLHLWWASGEAPTLARKKTKQTEKKDNRVNHLSEGYGQTFRKYKFDYC